MTQTHLNRAISRSVSPPQSEPLREDQVANSAGGFSWEVDKWAHLRRFLVLGSAGGTYYIGEHDLTKEGLKTVKACLADDPARLINEIVEISESGRAPKNDYALFALAVAVTSDASVVRRMALDALPRVARIGTHLFMFAGFLEEFGCLTGRAKRRAFANWYASKPAEKLAYEVIKYRQRDGWSHRDILRLSHPGRKVSSGNPSTFMDDDQRAILGWVAGKTNQDVMDFDLPRIISGFETIQHSAKTPEVAAELIEQYGLPREAVPTEFLKDIHVWGALLRNGMPLTALIRNLGNMTKIGLLTSQSDATQIVVNALKNDEKISKTRIHPMNVLFALKTYESGGGWRSASTWNPVTAIVDALDEAFYKAFGNVEPTGKRINLALDVSGSMGAPFGGTSLTCREASAAMALVTEAVEDRVEINGFSTTFIPLTISSRQRLNDATRAISGLPFRGTDCALPMLNAMEKGLEFDAFIVYTDSETWFGNVHPAKALEDYRKRFVPDAKLVVVGMQANKFSIADPKDAGMMDVVGFDTATPNIISDFVSGRI